MPLDPSIILASKPFDIQAAIKAAQDRQIQMRAQQDEHLLRGQQLANEQLQHQASLQALTDKQKSDAEQDFIAQTHAASGGDFSKTFDTLSKSGKVRASTLLGLQDKHAETVDRLSQTKKNDLANQTKILELMSGAAAAVLQSPPEQRTQVYAAQRQALIQHGIATPDQIPEQYDEAAVQNMLTHGQSALDIHKDAMAMQAAKDAKEKAAREKLEFDTNLPAVQSEAERKVIANAASLAAAIPDDAQRNSFIMMMNPKVGRLLMGKTPDQLRMFGQTANEQSQGLRSDQAAKALEEQRKIQNKQAEQRLGLEGRRVDVAEQNVPGYVAPGKAITAEDYLASLENAVPSATTKGDKPSKDVLAKAASASGGDANRMRQILTKKGYTY